MIARPLLLAGTVFLQCGTVVSAHAQTAAPATERADALKHVLHAARKRPFCALDWHELKLAAVDGQSAARVKKAL